MKYRFRRSEPAHAPRRFHRKPRLKGSQTLRHLRKPPSVPIQNLFELAALPEATGSPKPPCRRGLERLRQSAYAVGRRIFSLVGRVAHRARHTVGTVINSIKTRRNRPRKPKTVHALPVLAGFLCATVLVSLFSAGNVLLGLFGRYHRAYTAVTIPDFVGRHTADALQEDLPHLNLIVEYQTNPDVPEDTVISQSPRSGVTRRIYGARDFCTVRLTVSRPEEPYYLEDLTGLCQRDALLILQNHNLSASLAPTYSDTVPQGAVIETVPPSGTVVSADAQVLLRISLGARSHTVTVPNLFGLSESEANARLQSAGLTVDTVTYQPSSLAIGTVISQSLAATSQTQVGTAVSYTVSIGEQNWIATVPDLYGYSVTEAEQLLRRHGLVLGRIHRIEGAAPTDTVITQYPLPNSPITSATVSVDLYVTS